MRTVLAFLLLPLLSLCAIGQKATPDLVLVGEKIYTGPDEPPIENGAIVLQYGRIAAVGQFSQVKPPPGAKVIHCEGAVVTAGFWNNHVHILLPALLHADISTPGQLTSQLQQMLTRWGFTTVFDIASVLENTNVIRRRITAGEVKGPRILTTGEPFWIQTPVYVKDFLATNHVSIPEAGSPTQAQARVRQQVRDGVDGIKIFANSLEANEILTMPVSLAKPIVEEAHRSGKIVFAHVSNEQGIDVALDSGVDILAHTTPMDGPWSAAFAQRMAAAHVALTPTLTLWEVEEAKLPPAVLEKGMQLAASQLQAFRQAGGEVLFGTDVGYTREFDTSEEFKWMSRAGMSWQQILASLTTNPARRFGYASHSGRIAKGFDGDLTVLEGDPAEDVGAFSRVRLTIRDGEIIYARN